MAGLRKKRERDRTKLFLIDGIGPIGLALKSGISIEKIFYEEQRKERKLLDLAAEKGIILQPVSGKAAEKIFYGNNPDGHTALAHQPDYGIDKLRLPENPLIILTESLEKPGNTGAVMRSADAAGADAHIICDPVTDIFNPNIIRNSRGTLFTVPHAVASSSEAAKWLTEKGVTIYAAFPGVGIPYTEADFRGPSALCVGNEHSGLSGIWREFEPVHISMRGAADSLNAAQTGTLMLFEARRQRENSAV